MPSQQINDKPPYRWKTVRVFISSTFRDFHAERDYLIKYIFPDLRQWCEKWKLHLVDIDLRWGITEAESKSGKVIDICLEQIDGSQPFFICILGGRYGWAPDWSEIPDHTFAAYKMLAKQKNRSVTHLEIMHAVLYSLSEMKTFEKAASAFFYFRSSLPMVDDLPQFTKTQALEYARTFFETDDAKRQQLTELKKDIEAHFAKIGAANKNPHEVEEHIYKYTPEFDTELHNPEDEKLKGRLTTKSLEAFGSRVKSDLQKALSNQFQDRILNLSKHIEENGFEVELDLHESFIEHRTQLFVGRQKPLDILLNYVENKSDKIFAVYGESGSGKSALIAQFYKRLKQHIISKKFTRDVLVIPHFIGASPGSSALYNLLSRICRELKSKFNISVDIPSDTKKLPATFNHFLREATCPVIILIDGLNQLDNIMNAHDLEWLPEKLPPKIKIIASALQGKAKDALRDITDESLTIQSLTAEEQKIIIQKIPSFFCKSLEDKHIDELLKKEATRNPLYLIVALEELRVFGSHEKLGEKIKSLPDSVVELFESVLSRLEQDHDSNLVEQLFCLLECSKNGLSINEVNALTQPDDKDKTHVIILRQVRNYILNRNGLIDLFHSGFSRAIKNKYSHTLKKWHARLADYFNSLSLYVADKKENTKLTMPNYRKVSELPYHLIHSEQWGNLEKILCDLRFIDAKIRAGLLNALNEDFETALFILSTMQSTVSPRSKQFDRIRQYALDLAAAATNDRNQIPGIECVPLIQTKQLEAQYKKEQNNPSGYQRIKLFANLIARNTEVLDTYHDHPGMAIQVAYNQAKTGPVARAADRLYKTENLLLACSRRPYNPNPAHIRTLKYKDQESDYRYIDCLSGRPIKKKGDALGRAVLDIKHGERVHPRLELPPYSVSSDDRLALVCDGKKRVRGSDFAVRIWDMNRGQCISVLKGHRAAVQSVQFSKDKRLAASISLDGQLKIWNIETKTCSHTIEIDYPQSSDHPPRLGNGDVVSHHIIGDNSQIIVWSRNWVRRYDLYSGELLEDLALHESIFNISPRTLHAVGCDGKKNILVSDLKTGHLLHVLKPSDHTINAALEFLSADISVDGCHIMGHFMDRDHFPQTFIWNITKKNELAVIKNCTVSMSNGYLPAYITNNARWCISTGVLKDPPSDERLLKFRYRNDDEWDFKKTGVWDLKTGACLETFHSDEDLLVASITQNGNYAVTAGKGQTITIWDVQQHSKRVLKGHKDYIRSFSFSEDGEWGISGGGCTPPRKSFFLDLKVLKTGKILKSFEGEAAFKEIWMTPSATEAISIDNDKVRLWNLKTGECIAKKDDPGFVGSSVSISDDGRIAIANCCQRLRTYFWEMPVGKKLNSINAGSSSSISADGRRVAISEGGKISIWDLDSLKCVRKFGIDDQTFTISSLQMSCDGAVAAVYDWGGRAQLFDLAGLDTKKNEKTPMRSFESISFINKGQNIICIGQNLKGFGKVSQVLDFNTGIYRNEVDLGKTASVSEDGRRAVAYHENSSNFNHQGVLRIWELETGRMVKEITYSNLSPVHCIAATPDLRLAVTGGGTTRKNPELLIWDLDRGKVTHAFDNRVLAGRIKTVAITRCGNFALSFGRFTSDWDTFDPPYGCTCYNLKTGSAKCFQTDQYDSINEYLDSFQLKLEDFVFQLEKRPMDVLPLSKKFGEVVSNEAILPDGRRVYCRARGRQLEIYTIDTHKRIAALEYEAEIKACGIYGTRVAIGADACPVSFFNLNLK